MSFLQKAIGLRGYGQKDPLTEYKLLGYRQYLQMSDNVRRNVIYNVFQASRNLVTQLHWASSRCQQEYLLLFRQPKVSVTLPPPPCQHMHLAA